LPLVATAGLHKGSTLARHENDFTCVALAGIALSEERQLNGYRVRLRVVEEYDVALLAESPDDAKARAEADLRRGEQFEDIQDSWPEATVSVEALAVEPYPELE
jgi:hypothetical protein